MKLYLDRSGKFFTAESASGSKREFAFPAAGLSIAGKYVAAQTPEGKVQMLKNGGFQAVFRDGGFRFSVKVEPSRKGEWFFKSLEIQGTGKLPTPDYVDADLQTQEVPHLRSCGYRITNAQLLSAQSDEEGCGIITGWGYPLIGDDLFAGLEHPASFNEIVSREKDLFSWHLRHHPVWENGKIVSPRAVIGPGENAHKKFMQYVESFRLARRKNFLVSFCSFWSDPYLGNYEYKVDSGNYRSLVNAYSELGLRPDVYTLDAGWQDRKSFYDAKADFGGNPALKKLARLFREHGADLSLWLSHNGPMGMDPGFLTKQGIAVGGGDSCHYCGKDYGVLLDKKLEDALTGRFCELASPEYGAVHFKMDWENECATNPDFNEKYPTVNHVREGSVNVMKRISEAMFRTNPRISIRLGSWPSPWWLAFSTHTFLSDSGDSEYTTFPSLDQRNASTTHRDTMYYACLQRDCGAFPPDAYDNHEFAHALRNPFNESPAVWSDCCLWAFLRGASYIPMTLQPEALEEYQAQTLKATLRFARKYASRILSGNTRMLGGCPSHGEIYAFRHETAEGKLLLAVRNPAPVPQKYVMPEFSRHYLQTYPCCMNCKANAELWFAPHEIKLFEAVAKPEKLPFACCQLRDAGKGQYRVFAPASAHPTVAEIYRINELKSLALKCHTGEAEKLRIEFGVRVPYKMHNVLLTVKVKGKSAENVRAYHLNGSRYGGQPHWSCYAAPVREVQSNRSPNFGEDKNPDLQFSNNARYFAAEIPSGGESFCNLTFDGRNVDPDDVELFVSGYETPMARAEKERFRPASAPAVPPQHPDGFPRILKFK